MEMEDPQNEIVLTLNDYTFDRLARPLMVHWSQTSELVLNLPICLGGIWFFAEWSWKRPWWMFWWKRMCPSGVPLKGWNLFP